MTTEAKTVPKPIPALDESEFNKKWDPLQNYQVVRKSNDPRFGEIMILKDKTKNELIFSKEKWTTSKPQASNDIRDLKSRFALNHHNLQEFLGYSTATDKQMCSTNYLTCGYYRFPKSDLSKETADHIRNNTSISPYELGAISDQSLNALKFLHDQKICHADVRPIHIGYDKEKLEVKLLDRINDSSALEKVQGNNIKQKKDLFLSPELYKKLTGKDNKVAYSPFKNDSYALGLTLLNSGLNKNVQDVYEGNGNFNQTKLDGYLKEFNDKYRTNPLLVSRVNALLDPNESSRLEASDANLINIKGKKEVYVSSGLPDDLNNNSRVVTTTNYTTNYTPYGLSSDNSSNDGKLVTVLTHDGKSYSYIQRTGPSNNVVFNYDTQNFAYISKPPTQTYVSSSVVSPPVVTNQVPDSNNTPTNTTSYVVRNEPQTFSSPSYTPSYTTQEYNPNYVYKTEAPVSTVYTNSYVPQGNVIYSYVNEQGFTVQSSVNPGTTARSNSIEVRRKSSVPLNPENRSVTRKYVMKGDQLIEVAEPVQDISNPIQITGDSSIPAKVSVTEEVVASAPTKESIPEPVVSSIPAKESIPAPAQDIAPASVVSEQPAEVVKTEDVPVHSE